MANTDVSREMLMSYTEWLRDNEELDRMHGATGLVDQFLGTAVERCIVCNRRKDGLTYCIGQGQDVWHTFKPASDLNDLDDEDGPALTDEQELQAQARAQIDAREERRHGDTLLNMTVCDEGCDEGCDEEEPKTAAMIRGEQIVDALISIVIDPHIDAHVRVDAARAVLDWTE